MEQFVVKAADDLLHTQQKHLKSLSTNLNVINEEIIREQVNLDNLIQRNCLDKLFVEMIEFKKRLLEMKGNEKEFNRRRSLGTSRFVAHRRIIDVLVNYKQLGELVISYIIR
jgi:hypothetical protein